LINKPCYGHELAMMATSRRVDWMFNKSIPLLQQQSRISWFIIFCIVQQAILHF